jgi:sigma-E factor negative regulatory protein RseA
MSREALQESLSAVMDSEADELELRRVISALEDPQVRATWARYQVARAVMHKELLDPHLDLSAAVSVAIIGDSTPTLETTRGAWQNLGRLAVAASVTVAVLAGVRLYNQDDVAGAQIAQQAPAPMASSLPMVKGPAVLANYSESSELPAASVKHAQDAALKGDDGSQPISRAASTENR